MRSGSRGDSDRQAYLRELAASVEDLEFPSVVQDMAAQAADPQEPALQALMRASRTVLGDPSTAWDPLELQAMALAAGSPELQRVMTARLEQRWAAVRAVVRQLRAGSLDVAFDEDSAALHLLAVGLGMALLEPLSPRWGHAQSWAALSARLLEAISADTAGVLLAQDLTWRARVSIAATPTAMSELIRSLSLLQVGVDTLFTEPVSEGRQMVHLILRSGSSVDRETITHGLSATGTGVIVARGVSADTEDIPTRVLYLAARVVADPESAPRAAADLILADSWEVTDAATGDDASMHVVRLQWAVNRHVVLRRVRAPFTTYEINRAAALLSLVSAAAKTRGEPGFGWREQLRDGSTVVVRLARPDDAEQVVQMHERSSEDSRYQRYFAPMSKWREDNLRRIAGGHRGVTLVVTDQEESVIALGNVFPIGPDSSEAGEIAIMVEDAWHGHGIGLMLANHLIDVARQLGFDAVRAYVLATNRAMIELLGRTGLEWTTGVDREMGPTVVMMQAPV